MAACVPGRRGQVTTGVSDYLLVLDLVQTLAFAGVVLFLGYGIKRLVPPLARYNIPAPVVGGLLVSIVVLVAQQRGLALVKFDTSFQLPLQIAFFTTIGFGASLSLLRVGGPLVLLFFVFSTAIAVAQNVVGAGTALLVGQHPLLGVLAGSVTLTGGPATGLAFAPMFEASVPGAATVAVAAAMVGIVTGGLLGGPIGTFLIERYRLATREEARPASGVDGRTMENIVEDQMTEPVPHAPAGEDVEAYGLMKALVVILVAMWIGGWVSRGFTMVGITLPAYIGAMLVASMIRNLDDVTGLFGLSQKLIDDLGSVALSLFLVLALMTLELWKLAGLALPLAVILAAQLALVAVVAAFGVFRVMGRDYDSAVMSSGFVGFMLGTTANAMANMEALVQKFKPAPKAFLVVPMVGAFFIDFTNALIITAFVNFYR
jgi:glutamate:Na+ symporter, ESS family